MKSLPGELQQVGLNTCIPTRHMSRQKSCLQEGVGVGLAGGPSSQGTGHAILTATAAGGVQQSPAAADAAVQQSSAAADAAAGAVEQRLAASAAAAAAAAAVQQGPAAAAAAAGGQQVQAVHQQTSCSRSQHSQATFQTPAHGAVC